MNPDFHDLVGDEGTPEELAQLRRAHDLLIAAGPPPELSPRLADAPTPAALQRRSFLPRRRKEAVLVFAAALVAVAFGVGYLIGDRPNEFPESRSVQMHGVAQLASAQASLAIGGHDVGGNYPLEMTVTGLPHLPAGGWYELALSKQGKPTLPCGTFAVDGRAVTVRLSVPYDLSKFPKLFDGWVVVRHAPQQPSAVVMTT
jgi:hypothetical protein